MPLTLVGGEQSSSALATPDPRPTSPPDTNKAVASPTVSRFIVLPFTMPTVAGHAELATDAWSILGTQFGRGKIRIL
jgi:hypothetical protein